jgi:hypothetical protein
VELGRFEAAAGPFLDDLCYARGVDRPQPEHSEEAIRIRSLFNEFALKPVPSNGSRTRGKRTSE